MLAEFDDGTLRRQLNDAVIAVGHGKVTNSRGEHKWIGGSTGGGSRIVLDGWKQEDVRGFLLDDLVTWRT